MTRIFSLNYPRKSAAKCLLKYLRNLVLGIGENSFAEVETNAYFL